MRLSALTLVLGLALLLSAPASAQLAADVPGRPAPVEVVSSPQSPTLSLSGLFNSNTLKLSHGYEMSYQSSGYGDLGMGVYTTSLRWQPSARLAGRVDVGFAHGLFGSLADEMGSSVEQPVRPFLQNAELAWKPTDNSTLQLRVQQTPYGSACLYGSRYSATCGGGGYASGYNSVLGVSTGGDLFWRDDLGSQAAGGN